MMLAMKTSKNSVVDFIAGVDRIGPSLNKSRDHRHRQGRGRSNLTATVMLLLLLSTPAMSIDGANNDEYAEYVDITCYLNTQPFDYCFEQAYNVLANNEPRKTTGIIKPVHPAIG
ncbi:hypothetical protein E2562_017765 [Oryza meyeriana var. granulata]|uniref:Uncharacterized protein n=1 Tax=Oryza meyeriana var. granulata TaxID=110450 RepID=A0A6G1BXS4_9ORYZ|nr:hypothetical protein E2562_017765 [Oryza meyeriana var. granulata]